MICSKGAPINMLFNSIEFAIFLPLVFILYWFVLKGNTGRQNLLLVIASYVFYGWWDWRFLILIFFSTLVDFFVSTTLTAQNSPRARKLLLWTSIAVNLSFLGFFKYYNFFIDNFITAFTFFGHELSVRSLNVILPVGISFYTFQTLSYTIDVYRKKLEPTKDFIAFCAFVSFFPQLVAGPIERATNLLPQFQKQRTFEYTKAVDGLRQILWGLFKKIVIADNCAEYANLIFDGHENFSGSVLIVGAVFFSLQIYCDFSGYSDIAIGTSRLFGFNLMRNFAFPYFSRDIAEFWRRWHMSLSTWFRDYLYIPLGGSRGSNWTKIRNTFIVFIVSGFWHGANWTFVVWGAINALYFLPLLLWNVNRSNLDIVAEGRLVPSLREAGMVFFTFALTVFAWIFFRAESLSHAFSYISGIFSYSTLAFPVITGFKKIVAVMIGVFVILEWVGREHQHALAFLDDGWSRPIRYVFYFMIVAFIFLYGGGQQQFIYFQF